MATKEKIKLGGLIQYTNALSLLKVGVKVNLSEILRVLKK